MAQVELVLLVLAWVAIFSLFVLLPWAVVRVTVALLETDLGAVLDRLRPSVPHPERARPDGHPPSAEEDEPESPSVPSDHLPRER